MPAEPEKNVVQGDAPDTSKEIEQGEEQEEQEDANGWFIDISSFPDEGQIISPSVPYTGALPSPLAPGFMIVVDAELLPKAVSFKADLICGLSSRCDVALHVNPRLDEQRVVRNTRIHERWGEEEATGGQRVPLRRGQQFFLYIFVTETHFLIAFNGRHFCSYAHRLPLWRIHAVHIDGDLKIFQIEHRRDLTEYPLSSDTVAVASLAVPTLSCPGQLDTFASSHITNPEVPFLADLPQGLEVGRQIDVIGRVRILPNMFYLNFQEGKTTWPPPTVVFHFNPRFKEGNVVVRNSQLGGSWGCEERASGASFPFRPGYSFVLRVRCEEDAFVVMVNGETFCTFKYRCALDGVNAILLYGDIQVQDIYVH